MNSKIVTQERIESNSDASLAGRIIGRLWYENLILRAYQVGLIAKLAECNEVPETEEKPGQEASND